MQISPENNKRSSRRGRYRHQLVEPDFFLNYASRLSRFFGQMQNEWLKNRLESAEFVAFGLLATLACRGSDAFERNLSSTPRNIFVDSENEKVNRFLFLLKEFNLPSEQIEKRLESLPDKNLMTLLKNIRFRGVPNSARQALIHWLAGRYPLRLMFRIPSATEVFEMQRQGFRCVSFLINEDQLKQLHFDRDALSFVVHDLIHSEEFYSNPDRTRQQIGFYQWIFEIQSSPEIQGLLNNQPMLIRQWDYLRSDMNSYCGHLLKTCHAFLQINYVGDDFQDFWHRVISRSELNFEERLLFQRINQKDWTDLDFKRVEAVFESRGPTRFT